MRAPSAAGLRALQLSHRIEFVARIFFFFFFLFVCTHARVALCPHAQWDMNKAERAIFTATRRFPKCHHCCRPCTASALLFARAHQLHSFAFWCVCVRTRVALCPHAQLDMNKSERAIFTATRRFPKCHHYCRPCTASAFLFARAHCTLFFFSFLECIFSVCQPLTLRADTWGLCLDLCLLQIKSQCTFSTLAYCSSAPACRRTRFCVPVCHGAVAFCKFQYRVSKIPGILKPIGNGSILGESGLLDRLRCLSAEFSSRGGSDQMISVAVSLIGI